MVDARERLRVTDPGIGASAAIRDTSPLATREKPPNVR
jgi:hypothetical protein